MQIEQQCTINELVRELEKITQEKGYGHIQKLTLFTPGNDTIIYMPFCSTDKV